MMPGDKWMLTLTAPGDSPHFIGRSNEVCPCTPAEGINLHEWNSTASRAFNLFMTDLRRHFGQDVQVQYFKAAEVQKRGAIHFHLLLRFERPRHLKATEVRALAIHHGFGHSIQWDHLEGEDGQAKVSAYVAKYVAKAADQRAEVPWVDLETGEVITGARYRTWTASRQYGDTMKDIRHRRREYAAARRAEFGSLETDPPASAPFGGQPGGGRDAEGGPLDSYCLSYAPSASPPPTNLPKVPW